MTNSEETEKTRQYDWIRGVAKQLREEETVTVVAGGNERTLTVAEEARYVEREPYRCNGILVGFEGYGTEYTLEIDEKNERPPVLLYPSSDALGEVVKNIEAKGDESFGIVAGQTAAEMGIPER